MAASSAPRTVQAARAPEPHEAPAPKIDWYKADSPCPDGATLEGAAPPDGLMLSCKRGDTHHGPHAYFHGNGKVAQLGNYVAGRYEGTWMSFYEDGSPMSKETYLAGSQHGEHVRFHPMGQLAARSVWEHGIPKGTHVTYFEDGRRSSETPYVDGQIHGTARYWYENGNLAASGEYRHGVQHGEHVGYHENGNKAQSHRYDSGTYHGVQRQWSDTGALLGEFEIDQGTGVFKSWHATGALAHEQGQRRGTPHGVYKTYNERGQLMSEAKFEGGQQIGPMTTYTGAGEIESVHTSDDTGTKVVRYKGGKPAEFTQYDYRSSLRLEGTLDSAGKRHGETRFLDSFDDVRKVETYKHGALVSSRDVPRPALPEVEALEVGIESCDALIKATWTCTSANYDTKRMLAEQAKNWQQYLSSGSSDARAGVAESCRSQASYNSCMR